MTITINQLIRYQMIAIAANATFTKNEEIYYFSSTFKQSTYCNHLVTMKNHSEKQFINFQPMQRQINLLGDDLIIDHIHSKRCQLIHPFLIACILATSMHFDYVFTEQRQRHFLIHCFETTHRNYLAAFVYCKKQYYFQPEL